MVVVPAQAEILIVGTAGAAGIADSTAIITTTAQLVALGGRRGGHPSGIAFAWAYTGIIVSVRIEFRDRVISSRLRRGHRALLDARHKIPSRILLLQLADRGEELASGSGNVNSRF